MKELSLNILDIAQNSLAAKSTLVAITLDETDKVLTITVEDDGCGMDAETVRRVSDPFYTTRKTRKVGLGIPFFKLAAEQTGGSVTLFSVPVSESPEKHGTVIRGIFNKDSIDFTPLGDIISTVCTLIHGCGSTNITFIHNLLGGSVVLETAVLREVLGDVPLSTPDVMVWIKENLESQYEEISKV